MEKFEISRHSMYGIFTYMWLTFRVNVDTWILWENEGFEKLKLKLFLQIQLVPTWFDHLSG